MLDLHQKAVLITGASSGIGRACARRFAQAGARLVLAGRDQSRLAETRSLVEPAESIAVSADLASAAGTALVAERALERFGRVDVLINNAGSGAYTASFESSRDDVRRLFEVNLFSVVDLTNRLLPSMRAGSVVVNIGSVAGKVPLPWQTIYSASKFALNGYSDALRMELAGTGVYVVAVCPGYVDTPFASHALSGEIPERVRTGRPFKISAEQCAEAVFQGVRRGARTVYAPWSARMLVWAARLFPAMTYARLAGLHPVGERLARKPSP